jgi:hypothetical protein
MNRVHREQTGREMSDDVLVRQADKVVRYNQLPPEAEVVRRALLSPGVLDEHGPNVLLSTNELASLTGFQPKTIRRSVSRKLLNYIRVGSRLRFRCGAVPCAARGAKVSCRSAQQSSAHGVGCEIGLVPLGICCKRLKRKIKVGGADGNSNPPITWKQKQRSFAAHLGLLRNSKETEGILRCPLIAPKRIWTNSQRPRRARIRLKRRSASFRRSSKLEKLVS